eukprot:6225913-Pyramimonas_sp.AAC.1
MVVSDAAADSSTDRAPRAISTGPGWDLVLRSASGVVRCPRSLGCRGLVLLEGRPDKEACPGRR